MPCDVLRLSPCTEQPHPLVGHVTGDMKRRESNETPKRTALMRSRDSVSNPGMVNLCVSGNIASGVAVRGDSGVVGEGRVVGIPTFHSRGKCTMPLTNINSD